MKDGMIDFKLFEGFCFMMDGRTDEQTDRRTDICKLYMYVYLGWLIDLKCLGVRVKNFIKTHCNNTTSPYKEVCIKLIIRHSAR